MSTEKHIEETPEMAKARKAKAALKNVAANTAEIVAANEAMARIMRDRAVNLKNFASKVGDIAVIWYVNRDSTYVKLSDLLRAEARALEEGAV